MLRLRLRASFAAFRTFTAGAYRPTLPFLPPSAAYGLLMGVAGIETRFDDGRSPMTLMRPSSDLPRIRLAIGAVSIPQVQTLYQQLHNYPVGETGKEHADDCKGAKYNIQPIRREILDGLDAVVLLDAGNAIERRVLDGLKGLGTTSYGLPFLGDNNLLLDRLDLDNEPTTPARWLRRLGPEAARTQVRRWRLTTWIDRANMTRTNSALYAPLDEAIADPPGECCWTELPT